MIDVRNLTKSFGERIAVDDVSFTVDRGEVVGFLGPNGAGKTTTMRILTGFLAPTKGSVRVAGFDLLRESIEARRRIGYLPEQNPLPPEMRVGDYLRFRARLKGVPASEVRTRAGETMDRCGLKDRERSILSTLSRGLRQRVGIADAIVHGPELAILDEPTVGLDPIQVKEVRGLIRELGRERTVLLSTHILSEVEKVCDRVLILHRGRVVASGAPAVVGAQLTRTGRVRVETAGEGAGIGDALKTIPGVLRVHSMPREGVHQFLLETEPGRDPRGDIFARARDGGWNLRELAFERASLEDVFSELTQPEAETLPQEKGPAAGDSKSGYWASLFREVFRG